MNPTNLLRYAEIVLVTVITFVLLVATSIVLSGLIFHNGHSHIFLERKHWTCAEYSSENEIVAYKEEKCIVYRRNY